MERQSISSFFIFARTQFMTNKNWFHVICQSIAVDMFTSIWRKICYFNTKHFGWSKIKKWISQIHEAKEREKQQNEIKMRKYFMGELWISIDSLWDWHTVDEILDGFFLNKWQSLAFLLQFLHDASLTLSAWDQCQKIVFFCTLLSSILLMI